MWTITNIPLESKFQKNKWPALTFNIQIMITHGITLSMGLKSAFNFGMIPYQETGDLSDKPLHRGFKKIDPDKLWTYVKEHPDDTQQEIADVFGSTNQAVSKAVRKHRTKKGSQIVKTVL